jgi:hypothetical protein
MSISRKRRAAKLRTRRRRGMRQGRRHPPFSVRRSRRSRVRRQRGGAAIETGYPDAAVVARPDTGKYSDPDAVPTLMSADRFEDTSDAKPDVSA